MKKVMTFVCVCLSLLISCRKQIKPEVGIVETEVPILEAKTAPIGNPDTSHHLAPFRTN